jgi:hydroxymethylpyrimidine pyrophosphatase-like HAD family hydrolase
LDIDGTLLNSEGELTQRTADALYDFKQQQAGISNQKAER